MASGVFANTADQRGEKSKGQFGRRGNDRVGQQRQVVKRSQTLVCINVETAGRRCVAGLKRAVPLCV